jgi:hypothetical protein
MIDRFFVIENAQTITEYDISDSASERFWAILIEVSGIPN